MTLSSQILSSLRKRYDIRGARPRERDMRLLAPLSESLDVARPGQGLLDDIEAELDNDKDASRPPRARHRGPTRMILVFAAGALAATVSTLGTVATQDAGQQIIVRPAPGDAWLSLGAVSFEGAALRSFVAEKCKDNSHLGIVLSGYQEKEKLTAPEDDAEISGTPLMTSEEKILMRCNF